MKSAKAQATAASEAWKGVEKERQRLHTRWRGAEADLFRAERVALLSKDRSHVHAPPSPVSYQHPETADYYNELGVEARATEDEIRRAFRERSKQAHPDKHHGANKAAAEAEFQRLTRAHEVLTHPQLRSAYDRGENIDLPKVERRIRDESR